MRALEITRELKKGCLPGYIITGEDEYLKRFVKESLLATIPKEERMFSYIPMELAGPNKADVGSIVAAAETYTMMLGGSSSKKMIDILPFDTALTKSDEAILKSYFENPAPDSFILFEGASKAENFLINCCEIVDCSKCNDTELYIYVDKKRAANKYNMDQACIKKLISLCNNDFGRIDTELEKLFMYTYETKNITNDVIDLLVIPTIDNQVFELTNAISTKNNEKAMEILNNLMSKGARSSSILSALSSTYRRLFQVGIATTPDDVTMSALRLSSGALYMNRKIVTQNRNKDKAYIQKLKKIVEYLLDLEYKFKSYTLTEDKALDLAMSYLMNIQ